LITQSFGIPSARPNVAGSSNERDPNASCPYGVAEQLPGTPIPLAAVKQLVPGLWYYAEDGEVPPP